MEHLVSSCPPNSLLFNSTLCACNPGYLMNPSGIGNCTLFKISPDQQWAVSSGVDYSIRFPKTIFSFDSITKFTQSQAIFLEATLIALLSWFAFCLAVRLGSLDGGRSPWFRIRWWISRLDFCYATRHWLEDQKFVMKRKTELGGTFSVASGILFIGLFAALLYHIIAKRTVEVYNLKPANAPELLSFVNDMEFNITTISSMSCSHLRGLGTLVSGTPGSTYHRVSPLSTFSDYYCHNTSKGPTVTIKCSQCRVPPDDFFISWQFVDLPNDPATAVGFQFNLTAKNHGDNKHVSFVSGTLKSRSNIDDKPNTFRGADVNVLEFHLFPRIYHNFHNLRLIQPLFHEFLPGSSFFDSNQLQASLQSSKDGLINTTLHVNFLSDYIVEIDNENILGPVSFIADVGGLCAISFAIFFACLLKMEYKIKKLRIEDSVFRNIRSQRRAQLRWDKLRKYVMYTWGRTKLDEKSDSSRKQHFLSSKILGSFSGMGSLHKRKQQSRSDSINYDKRISHSVGTNIIPKGTHTESVNSCLARSATDLERNFPSEGEDVPGHEMLSIEKEKRKDSSSDSCKGDIFHPQVPLPNSNRHQLPPVQEISIDVGTDISVLQRNLQDLRDYNVRLEERLIAAESLLEDLLHKVTLSSNTCPT
ncbi:uncharacterized protein LOC143847188 isoform X2 [Tasmannia lanceolata]|uniref:uncharacterized protein LOC143847188 isoform X2 n=1 Tax=Tasmannia lanceolata TaxID=3420 RepID=UPI00406497FC